jgi:hypothetical protein
MRFNHFENMNTFGFQFNGQGSVMNVEATHRITLRSLISIIARRLSLRSSWRSLKRTLTAGSAAFGGMTPAPATCPAYTAATRGQRHQRWMSGVVVDPGTVGVG